MSNWEQKVRERHHVLVQKHTEFSCPETWASLVDDIFFEMEIKAVVAGIPPVFLPIINCVKEENGTLIIEFQDFGYREVFDEIVKKAREKSAKKCVTCNLPGTIKPGDTWSYCYFHRP